MALLRSAPSIVPCLARPDRRGLSRRLDPRMRPQARGDAAGLRRPGRPRRDRRGHECPAGRPDPLHDPAGHRRRRRQPAALARAASDGFKRESVPRRVAPGCGGPRGAGPPVAREPGPRADAEVEHHPARPQLARPTSRERGARSPGRARQPVEAGPRPGRRVRPFVNDPGRPLPAAQGRLRPTGSSSSSITSAQATGSTTTRSTASTGRSMVGTGAAITSSSATAPAAPTARSRSPAAGRTRSTAFTARTPRTPTSTSTGSASA